MSLGGGIALVVIGAILRFAITADVPGVDLPMIGTILMGAGVVVFIVGLALMLRRRSSVTTSGTTADGRAQVTRSSSSGGTTGV